MNHYYLAAYAGLMTLAAHAGSATSQPVTWHPIPWITAEARALGIAPGGEGGQWPRAIAMDQVDGQFMIWGTDVGGLYRSLDGGRTWEPSNVGYTPRGTAGLAIDPHNPDRVLSVGANSVVLDQHGLYLSTDRAASWSSVLPLPISGAHDFREQLAFDPSSWSDADAKTLDVYWSRIGKDTPKWGQVDPAPAMYKSTDGGVTWHRLPDTSHLGDGIVRVHPSQRGVVYVANGSGLYRSDDAGEAFVQLLDEPLTGLAISGDHPDAVWISTAHGLRMSPDRGKSWSDLAVPASVGGRMEIKNLQVSPASANHLVLDTATGLWAPDAQRFASHDGGRTWRAATLDNTGAFLPPNRRNGLFAMHPTDTSIVYSTGGDWPTVSHDGGLTYRWVGNGVNAVFIGGLLHFNPHDPGVVFVGSQDYNGAVTRDGGHTWTYCNVAGLDWGGYTYAGYAITADRLIVGKADRWGGDRVLRVSTDGGQTWGEVPDVRWGRSSETPFSHFGYDTAMGDPAEPNVAFIAGYRTDDAGRTWRSMEGCHGVFTASARAPHHLFGLRREPETGDTAIVASRDHGVTWEVVHRHSGPIRDLAYDPERERIYAAADAHLLVVEGGEVRVLDVPADQLGNRRVTGVAVDPVDSDVVYVAQHQDRYAADNSVSRSTDAGQSWSVLTRRAPLVTGAVDGGREAVSVRVHPATREAWIISSCYGIWRVGPPDEGE